MNITPNTSPRVPNAAASPSRRWRDLALLGGLLLLVILGLAGLAAATGWDETWRALASLSIFEVALLLVFSLANYVTRSLRWHLFATRLGLELTLAQNTLHFIGGFAMSVTPGRVGELIRMRWIRRETSWSFDRTAPLVLVDRAADLSAMGILLALSLALSTSGLKGGVPVAVLALAAAYVATRPKLLYRVAGIGHRITGRRFSRLFARVRRAAQSLKAFSNPSVLMIAGALGVLGWFAEGYAFHLLLVWLGADIGLWTALGIFIFATIVGGLTGAPGGLGGAEATMVALLALDGVPLEIAIPATLVIRVTTLWFAVLIGLAVFPAAEHNSKKVQHALEG